MSVWNRIQGSKKWLVLPPLVLGIVVVFLLKRMEQELPRTPATTDAIAVEVITLSEQPVRPSITGYGTARPKRIWTAVAEVGGVAIEIHPQLRSGNEVKEHELLLAIDPTDYRLRAQQRMSDVNQAEAELRQLELARISDVRSLELQKSLLSVRQQEVNRLRELQGNRAASQSEYDAARAALLQQQISVETLQRSIDLNPAQQDAAKAAILFAKARLDEAQQDVQRTTVEAPFNGLLSGVTLEQSQYVAPGQELFELHDSEAIEVEAQFSLSQMSRLIPNSGNQVSRDDGTPSTVSPSRIKASELLPQLVATVTVRSGDLAVQFPGRAIRATSSIDQATRTIGIIIEVSSLGEIKDRTVALRSGAYCEVVLQRTEPSMQMVIPRTAIRDGLVFVVDDANRLRSKAIRPLTALGRELVVDGLDPGDRLVVRPPVGVADGVLVDPTTDPRDEVVQ